MVENQSLATLMFDMVINHGQGPKVINTAINKTVDKNIPATGPVVFRDTITAINRFPEPSYKAISAARVAYVESLKEKLGPDYNNVLSRAKSFLNKYVPVVAIGGGVVLIIAALFF
jgi:hypothetical protein